jgi:hypothetical protein
MWGALVFGFCGAYMPHPPRGSARIFDNRIGLLEASTLMACCRVGSLPGIGWWSCRLDSVLCVESGERSLIDKASAGLGFGQAAQMNLRV